METLAKKTTTNKNTKRTIAPANISESKEAYIISLLTPGFKKEEIELNIKGTILTAQSKETEEKDSVFAKPFKRSFELPSGKTDNEKIEAQLSEGILTIILPKAEQKTTSISID